MKEYLFVLFLDFLDGVCKLCDAIANGLETSTEDDDET